MKNILVILIICITIGCSKKEANFQESPYKLQSQEFESTVRGRAIQLEDYRASSAVKYTDSTNEETDLNHWVSPWVEDDSTILHENGELTIYQQNILFPLDSSSVLTKKWRVTYDDKYVYFHYLAHDYTELVYKVEEWNSEKFIIYIDYKGVRLISTFKFL
jgi:hypothetical protein